MKSGKRSKKSDYLKDKEFLDNSISIYPRIRKIVIATFGDALQNLSEKRREKFIQRGVLLWIKSSNNAVQKALDVIHFPEFEEEEEHSEKAPDIPHKDNA